MAETIRINIAEMKKDISYIKKGLDQNLYEHKEIRKEQKGLINKFNDFINTADDKFESKADKEEVDFLKNKLWASMIALILILLSIIAFLLKHNLHLN